MRDLLRDDIVWTTLERKLFSVTCHLASERVPACFGFHRVARLRQSVDSAAHEGDMVFTFYVHSSQLTGSKRNHGFLSITGRRQRHC